MKNALFPRLLRHLVALLLVVAAANATAAGYSTRSGRIYDESGREIQLRGISHFGFNAPILQPQYLWAMGWKEQIAQIKNLGFNAIRVPFVPDTLYNTTPVNQLSYLDPGLNPEFVGKTPLQALDLWMAEAERQGMYILLDFHSVSMQRQYPTWYVSNPADFSLIYNKQAYTREHWLRDLEFVARRYAALGHFLGIDIYNEPNGSVRWSTGDVSAADPINFWKDAAERAATAVLAANPKLMIFVQGINGNFDGREDTNIPMNWGEDFQPHAYQPLNIPADKLVLSPHTYGPDVYFKSSFSASNFPANLAAHWETLFGRFASTNAVVIGEWGGRYGSGTGGRQDVVWQEALVDYLISKGMRSSFYWSYTPNSGDTGGILDDGLKVRQDKLALLQRLWGSAGNVAAPPPVAPAAAPPAVAPPAYAQPSIMSMSPLAGPVGTVVTLRGSGFTGLKEAWVGEAHGVAVGVLSDTQAEVVIPAGATNGAIGIFNAKFGAFTSSWFTVVSAPSTAPVSISQPAPSTAPSAAPAPSSGGGGATGVGLLAPAAALLAGRFLRQRNARTIALPQQHIAGFSPTSGPVGTVVTITGSGFTGSTLAWAGAARNATVTVLSDTQLRVTIPSGATTGAIGIFNAEHSAFTSTAFTVK
jgi:endoglucanase